MKTHRVYGLVQKLTEKEVERRGDVFMATIGFDVWKLSQPRKTMQTPGWPDRLYTHAVKGLALYWEAKRPGGRQRDGQRAFQAAVTACGMQYVCGQEDVLHAWAEGRGLVRMLASGGLERIR